MRGSKTKKRVKERRHSSHIKPWIFLFLELSIYISMGTFIILYFGNNTGLPLALAFVAGMIYKTKTFQRMEEVFERNQKLKKDELIEQYHLKD